MKKNNTKPEEIKDINSEIDELEQQDDIRIEENVSPRKLKRQKRNRFFFIMWNLLSVIFYSSTTFASMSKKWGNSAISYVVLGGTLIYIVVFLVLIICSSRNKKVMKTEIATYKTQMALWRTILNFINIAMAVLVIINVAKTPDPNFFVKFSLYCAILLVTVRIIMGIRKVIKLIRKQKKLNEKKKKLKETNNK